MTISPSKDKVMIAWGVGLFEGKGCIAFITDKYGNKYPKLILVSTDEDVLRRFRRIVGGGYISHKESANPNHKIAYRWQLQRGRDIQELLIIFMPMLGTRRKGKAREALAIKFKGNNWHSKSKIRCIRGHRFTRANTRIRSDGTRQCVACIQIRSRKSYLKKITKNMEK